MKIMRKIKKVISNPKLLYWRIMHKMITKFNHYEWNESFFLKVMWGNAMQYDLPLDNPQTFNEKIQWIKLNDRKKIYNTMVDKYEAKKYVIDKIGTGYTSETYGVWNRWDDIDFDKLP